MSHWLSSWAPWSYIVLVIVVGVILVPLWIRRSRAYQRAKEVRAQFSADLQQRGQQATGRVVDYETVFNYYSDSTSAAYAPIISFFTPDGRENRFRAAFNSSPKAFVPGHAVTVAYDPYNMANVRVVNYNWEDESTITRGYKIVRPLFKAFPLVFIGIFLVAAVVMFGIFIFILQMMGG